jgi:hypothetical protein
VLADSLCLIRFHPRPEALPCWRHPMAARAAVRR